MAARPRRTNPFLRLVSGAANTAHKRLSPDPQQFRKGMEDVYKQARSTELRRLASKETKGEIREESRAQQALEAATDARVAKMMRSIPDRAGKNGLVMREELEQLVGGIQEHQLSAQQAHQVLLKFFNDYRPQHPQNPEHVALIMQKVYPEDKRYHAHRGRIAQQLYGRLRRSA